MKKLNYTNLFAMFTICFCVGMFCGGLLIQSYVKKCIELRYTQYNEANESSFGSDETLEAKNYIINGETE